MLWNLVRNLVIVLKLKESNLFKTRVKHHIIFIVFHINIVKTTQSGAVAGLVVDAAIATGGLAGVAIAAVGGFAAGSLSDIGSQVIFEGAKSWDDIDKKRALTTGAKTGVVNVVTFGLGAGLNKAMGFKPSGTFFQKLCQGVTKAGVAGWVFTSITAPALSAFPVLPSWLDD